MLQVSRDIIQADDKIEYQAEKVSSDGKRRVILTDNWREKTKYLYRDKRPVITSYWNPDTKEHLRESEYIEKGRPENFAPVITRTIELDRRTRFIFEGNNIKLRIDSLVSDFQNRYLKAVIALKRAGIIKYTPLANAKEPERSHKEAIRHRLNKYFHISEYEWDIFFYNPALGKIFYKHDYQGRTVKKIENTIYLQGFSTTGGKLPVTIKMYNHSAHKRGDSIYNYQKDDLIKIEFTYRHEFFKTQEIKIKDITEPARIYEGLNSFIRKYFERVYYQLTDTERREVRKILKVNEDAEAVESIMSADRVLQELSERVEALEREQKRQQESLEEIKARLYKDALPGGRVISSSEEEPNF